MNNNQNTSNLDIIRPLIFTKKINENSKIIPLNTKVNEEGQIRHFPPANKEWFNSIYAYNSNYIKSLPSDDKNLTKLINSYFNLYITSIQPKQKSKRINTRTRRLSVKKIFVSKPELKHTSSKVIITLYVYNEQKRLILKKIKNLERVLFPLYLDINPKVSHIELNPVIKGLSTKEGQSLLKKADWAKAKLARAKNLSEFTIEKNMTALDLANKSIIEQFEEESALILGNPEVVSDNMFEYYIRRNIHGGLIKKVLEKELLCLTYYKLLLEYNKSKFQNRSLARLSDIISILYNKDVEFNIVNLKYLYLDSNMLSQVIALKLKNRDNRVLKVLRSAISMVKLPVLNKLVERYNKGNTDRIIGNKVEKVSSIFEKDIINANAFALVKPEHTNLNKDGLNQFLLDRFTSEAIIEKTTTLDKFVYNSLKHHTLSGVRLEARGRLTKRFTASRAVFKLKWKGSLKNIDSSYRGLSSSMLRGQYKSNVQYSIIHNKTRNGAFGIKGWISSK